MSFQLISLSGLSRVGLGALFTLFAMISANAQEDSPYLFHSGLATYLEYSSTSSHILLGSTGNRRVAALGVEYKHVLRAGGHLAWYYVGDVSPVLFLQDPVSTTTQTIQFGKGALNGPFTIQTGPIPTACPSSVHPDPNNFQYNVTVTDTRVCGTRWTYSGGASPVGQELVFLPNSRIQPYGLLNGGVLFSTRGVPADHSSAFNFTFEFGGGVRIMQSDVRGVSLDYRIRHLSNRDLGDNNPGIDNQIVRLSYIFGRRQ